jgi:hypothetical protein
MAASGYCRGFGELPIAAIDEDRVRDCLDEMLELVAGGELSPKTVNNARTCLSMTLGEPVRRGHWPTTRAGTSLGSRRSAASWTTWVPTRSSAASRRAATSIPRWPNS